MHIEQNCALHGRKAKRYTSRPYESHFDMNGSAPTSPLLCLLQLCDSAFPTGAYAFSDGLETFTQTGQIRTAAQLEQLLAVQLQYGWGSLDLPACALAWAAYPDPEKLEELDAHLTAFKVIQTVRNSSLRIGANLGRTAQTLWPQIGELPIHQATVFGAVARALEIPQRDAVTGFASSWLIGKATASTRLFKIGGLETQTVVARLQPLATEAIERSLETALDDLSSFTPTLDLAAQQQASLPLRLFQS